MASEHQQARAYRDLEIKVAEERGRPIHMHARRAHAGTGLPTTGFCLRQDLAIPEAPTRNRVLAAPFDLNRSKHCPDTTANDIPSTTTLSHNFVSAAKFDCCDRTYVH